MNIRYFSLLILLLFVFLTLSCDTKNEQYSENKPKERTVDNKATNTNENNKKPTVIDSVKIKKPSDNSISSYALLNDFSDNQIRANNKYQNKKISIRGKIYKITKSPTDYTIIEINATKFSTTSIQCALLHSEDKKALQLSKGDEIIITGKCSGKLNEHSDIYMLDCKLK